MDLTKHWHIALLGFEKIIPESEKIIIIDESKGIRAIIANTRDNQNGSRVIYKFLIDKTKYNESDAMEWVNEHEKDFDWVLGHNSEINLSTGEEKKMTLLNKDYQVELKKFNDEERSFEAIASTEAVDRDGDILRTKGWNLKNYKKNPVVLWGHNSEMLPIAKATDIRVEDNKLIFTPKFVPKDIYPFADQVYEMYKTGYLKSFSVRFDPVKWEDIAIDENARRAGVRQRYGREYKEQDLLEISAVNIPANPEAMANKDYQDFIVKSFIADNLSLIKDQTVKDSLLKGEIKEKETIDLLNEEIVELKKRIELFESIEKNITELKNETEAQTLIKKCQEGITLLAKIGSK